jgi:hypothetical protein
MNILWTRSTLIGLLVAEAKLPLIPAEPWPLEAAIETLLEAAPEKGELGRAALGWLRSQPSPSGRIKGVRSWIHEATESGILVAEGRGWQAGYRPTPRWLTETAALRGDLDLADAQALEAAAQCLVAMSTMLWKKAAA